MGELIEVEFIGGVSKEEFEKLKRFFKEKGVYKETKRRISFMYFRDKIPKDISEIGDEEVDLRLRVTNKKPELVLKKGLFTGTHSREEISIKFPKKEIEKYIKFLSILGWHLGVIYATEIFVYEYKGVEFSLVNIKDYGYNFEAEMLVEKGGEKDAEKKIKEILNELNLKPFDKKGIDKQCNEINNRKELHFDFSKQKFEEMKKRFKEFF